VKYIIKGFGKIKYFIKDIGKIRRPKLTALYIQQLDLIILLDDYLLSRLDWIPIQPGQQTVI